MDYYDGDTLVATDTFTTQCHVCGVPTEYLNGQRVDTRCEHEMGKEYDDPILTHNVQRLLRMPDGDFRDLVAEDVRGTRVEALRHDDVVDRWGEALTALYLHVEAQLSGVVGELDRETRGWRRAARTFQAGVAQRKQEHKRVNFERHQRRSEEARQAKAERIAAASTPKGPRKEKSGTKEERTLAGEVAIRRLITTHREEFDGYLAEALAALGVDEKRGSQS